MSWGGNPRFRISQRELDFATAAKIWKDPDYRHRGHHHANISDSRPSRSHFWIEQGVADNPVSNKHEECYRLLMYHTYIHTWWEDGTYRSIYWNSGGTRTVLSAFGPVQVWNDSRSRYCCKARFGRCYKQDDFPYRDGITVDPEGWVRGLVDFKYVLKPNAKKERAVIREQLRANATSRIMLGEFGDAFAAYKHDVDKGFGRADTGWMAQVPTRYSKVAELFYKDADHAPLQEAIEQYGRNGFHDGPCRPTKEQAMLAAIDAMADQLLGDHGFEWYEKKPVHHGDVNVRRL